MSDAVSGGVSILNVGDGDTTLTFDPSKPRERERAAKIVQDMLRRGYAILVEVGRRKGEPLYQRIKEFDPEKCEYIISGGPEETVDLGAEPKLKASRRPKTRRIAAEQTKAVAIGRTAGG